MLICYWFDKYIFKSKTFQDDVYKLIKFELTWSGQSHWEAAILNNLLRCEENQSKQISVRTQIVYDKFQKMYIDVYDIIMNIITLSHWYIYNAIDSINTYSKVKRSKMILINFSKNTNSLRQISFIGKSENHKKACRSSNHHSQYSGVVSSIDQNNVRD
jgi:hypothetical protein